MTGSPPEKNRAAFPLLKGGVEGRHPTARPAEPPGVSGPPPSEEFNRTARGVAREVLFL